MTAAYGVRFGADDSPADWPHWDVEVSLEAADDAPGMSIWPDTARIGMPGAGELRLDRLARTIAFAVRNPLSEQEILHPGLAPAAVVIANWACRASLHAAAVVTDSGVWVLLGERGAGKSTTAALLCERGCGLFTDDVLIVTAERAFAGPPSVDLRAEAAARLGGEPLPHRDRWRYAAARPLLEAPVAGFVTLEWAERASITPIDGTERLTTLLGQLVLGGMDTTLLDLATLPMLRAQRPREFAAADAAAGAILTAIAEV